MNAPVGDPPHDASAPAAGNGVAESDLSAHLGDLAAGENVLAIQGLNVTAEDDDFLMAPGLSGLQSSLARAFFQVRHPAPPTGRE